jgi:hypothetical protein
MLHIAANSTDDTGNTLHRPGGKSKTAECNTPHVHSVYLVPGIPERAESLFINHTTGAFRMCRGRLREPKNLDICGKLCGKCGKLKAEETHNIVCVAL